MEIEDLKCELDSILHPEADADDRLLWVGPHPRLSSVHGLDTSYFRGPYDLKGDSIFTRLLSDESDPLHNTLESASVPLSLFTAALELFGDSLVEYHHLKKRWGVYRFYPSILMTAWAAFESWLRISSEILVAVAPKLPGVIKDALLEKREIIDDSGKFTMRRDSRPVLMRYWLLLKYGCNLEWDRGGLVWQTAERTRTVRDSLVHYHVQKAPALTSSDIWNHMEAVLMLFIAPSTTIRRTLFGPQFDLYSMLAALEPLIAQFEERPFHKDWPKDAKFFDCPFDGVDENKYRLAGTRDPFRRRQTPRESGNIPR